MAGGREEGEYSEDEDTDTEEYKEAKPKYRTLFLLPAYTVPHTLSLFIVLYISSLAFHLSP